MGRTRWSRHALELRLQAPAQHPVSILPAIDRGGLDLKKGRPAASANLESGADLSAQRLEVDAGSFRRDEQKGSVITGARGEKGDPIGRPIHQCLADLLQEGQVAIVPVRRDHPVLGRRKPFGGGAGELAEEPAPIPRELLFTSEPELDEVRKVVVRLR